MENGVSSNLRSPGGAVRNSSGIFYALKDLSSYTLSMGVPRYILSTLFFNPLWHVHMIASSAF